MDHVLAGLRAAGEPTRLRLLALCAGHELTVSELTAILGQSQPRVSRHLKVLCEAGLLERFPEGTSIFYRVQRSPTALPERLIGLIPADDPVRSRDSLRLAEIQNERARRVAAYFETNAHQWDTIRGLYVPEREVEAKLLELSLDDSRGSIREILDVGTGTGRMLELFGRHVERGIGIDLSREMLSVARVNLERAGLRNCAVRQADMRKMPFSDGRFDLVILHQVLHFAESPGEVLAEATRVLRPGGCIMIVDFAPHDREFLREEHAHRRLGFSESEVREWGRHIGLTFRSTILLPSEQLTIAIWTAIKPEQQAASLRVPDSAGVSAGVSAGISGMNAFSYGEPSF